MKKSLMYVLATAILLGGMVGARSMLSYKPNNTKSAPVVQQITYLGEAHKNALDLLKAGHTVNLDASGMVAGIDGRQADTSKHEYWAFYINNKLASVGPKDYLTLPTDQIMWKIETY